MIYSFFNQLYTKWKNILHHSLLISFSKVLSSGFNLLFMIMAVKILSKTENGYFQYYLGYFPIILCLADFGLPSAIIKYLSPKINNSKQVGMILSSAFGIKAILFLILLALATFISFFLEQNIKVILILVIGAFLVSFTAFFESIFISFGLYYSFAFWNPLQNILRFSVLIFFFYFSDNHLNYLDVLAIFLLTPILSLFTFFFIFDRKKLKFSKNLKVIKKTSSYLIKFNTYAFFATIFAISSDRLEIFF